MHTAPAGSGDVCLRLHVDCPNRHTGQIGSCWKWLSSPFPKSQEGEIKDCSKVSGEIKFKEERLTLHSLH